MNMYLYIATREEWEAARPEDRFVGREMSKGGYQTYYVWVSGRPDSNRGLSAPKADALPD